MRRINRNVGNLSTRSPAAAGAMRARNLLLTAALIAVTLLAYAPALRGGFFWDDGLLILNNPLVKAPDGLRRIWLTSEAAEYVPLTFTMRWVEWRLWGGQATGYHVLDALLHAAGAVLLWRVLLRLRVPGAWLAGLLFAVHPVAAASAAWISEQKNTLSLAFFLASLLAFLRFDERSETGEMHAYLLSVLLFFLALLAKASVVMLPAVLLLCAWWRRGKISGKDFLRSAPFFALSLVLGLVTVWFQNHNAIHGHLVRPEGIASRVAASGWIAWFYLLKVLLPAGLCAIYPRWEVDGSQLLGFLPLVLLAAGLAALWARRKSWGRAPLFALGYFLIMLLPVLGFADMSFMQHSLVADHLQYTAMIGVIAFAAGCLARAGSKSGRRTAAAAGCAVVLGILTWRRAALYGNAESLWLDNVGKNPAAWAAWRNLGQIAEDAGQPEKAVRAYDKLIEVRRKDPLAFLSRAEALDQLGRCAEAIRDCSQAIALEPHLAMAYHNRAKALERLGRYAEALDDCDQAIREDPALAAAYVNRGNIRMDLGRPAEAAADYEKAVSLVPDSDTFFDLGAAHAALGRPDLAIRDFSRAIEMDAAKPDAYYNRALAYFQEKQYEKARADLRRYEDLGGTPDAKFLHALREAAGGGP